MRPEAVHGFATPSIFHTRQGSDQVIVPGSYQLTAYSAATGERLWWVRGLTWQVKPTAVVSGDTIYVTGWAPGADAGERQNLPPFEEVLKEGDKDGDGKLSPEEVPERLRHKGSWNAIDLGRDGFLDGRDWSFYRARRSAQNVTMAVRPGDAKGDLTETHVLWQIDRSVPVVSSPLLYKDVLYTIKDGGILSALDPANGRVHKQARLAGAIDSYYASPVAADGKIFVVSETGKLSVVKAGKEWELLSLNDLHEACYATPALADGRMYLRTQTKLYCFGKPWVTFNSPSFSQKSYRSSLTRPAKQQRISQGRAFNDLTPAARSRPGASHELRGRRRAQSVAALPGNLHRRIASRRGRVRCVSPDTGFIDCCAGIDVSPAVEQ